MSRNRGFSLLLVLLVMVVLAIVGVSAATMSQLESGVSSARTMRRQALAAAEAGLQHFFGSAPAVVKPNTYYIGSVGSDPSSYVYLKPSHGPNGETIQSRYRVRSTVAGPATNSVILIAEGETLVNGKVAGKARVSAIVSATAGTSGGAVGTGQKSLGAWGTSSNLPARSDISLVNFD